MDDYELMKLFFEEYIKAGLEEAEAGQLLGQTAQSQKLPGWLWAAAFWPWVAAAVFLLIATLFALAN